VELFELASWLKSVFAPFTEIDGYLFFTGRDQTREQLVERVRSHPTTEEAQRWMNIVLLDRFLDHACGDSWESDDADARAILATIRGAWEAQIRADFPSATFVITDYIDDDAGDFGLRLLSTQRDNTPA